MPGGICEKLPGDIPGEAPREPIHGRVFESIPEGIPGETLR